MAVVLHTTSGDLPILLYYQACPLASFNFLALCASGYFDGCHFYRHFPGILLQTGDPTNSGKGGESIFARLPPTSLSSSSQPSALSSSEKEDANSNAVVAAIRAAGGTGGRYFADEGFGTTTHAQRGVLSMAHKGTKADTNASQFFITTSAQPSFDRMYTAFGAVDLKGVSSASSTIGVREAAEGDAKETGDAVLQALEAACAEVDAKNFVKKAAQICITGATVLYNPFAEGKATL